MNNIYSLLIFLTLAFVSCQPKESQKDSIDTSQNTEVSDSVSTEPGPITIVIHGGAGNIKKESMTPEREAAYTTKLEEALNQGYWVLEKGGSSLDAVTATIQVLEESPLFNAGKGSVFTNEGKNELDAAIMDGATGNAGAVAGVSKIKSPILAARTVMEKSEHVMMARDGAEKFAEEEGLEMVDPTYFYDENRFQQLEKIRENETAYMQEYPDYKYGTVGCIALDKEGNIAAGTSTGGMTNKKFGRIGDSPIIGAGTYADNNTCGVSGTGHGEYFIKNVVAYDIAALMKYKGMSLKDAANHVVMEKLVEKEASGGVVALDKHGNIAMPFNTSGMFRGYINKKDDPKVFMFKD